ncbi:MAG: Sec-independent protein translocase subunit TatA/TatB [Thermoleophilaceae bacterium]
MGFLSPSPIELMMIAAIALIVLGPSRLPEAARSLGKGMREMRNSFQSGDDDDRDDKRGPDPDDDDPDADDPDADGIDDDASFDELDSGDEPDEAEPEDQRASVGVER